MSTPDPLDDGVNRPIFSAPGQNVFEWDSQQPCFNCGGRETSYVCCNDCDVAVLETAPFIPHYFFYSVEWLIGLWMDGKGL